MVKDALDTRYQLLHGEAEAARAELRRLKAAAEAGREVVVVSACAAGVRCGHDGRDRARALPDGVELLPLCPEVLGRLGVPRAALALDESGKRIVDARGRDVTSAVDQGARLADLYASEAGATRALLLDGSVSCGVTRASESAAPGGDEAPPGRFAARLHKRGLPIVGV